MNAQRILGAGMEDVNVCLVSPSDPTKSVTKVRFLSFSLFIQTTKQGK